jgi:hypothetical protein
MAGVASATPVSDPVFQQGHCIAPSGSGEFGMLIFAPTDEGELRTATAPFPDDREHQLVACSSGDPSGSPQ